jgi:hypothetical protein
MNHTKMTAGSHFSHQPGRRNVYTKPATLLMQARVAAPVYLIRLL